MNAGKSKPKYISLQISNTTSDPDSGDFYAVIDQTYNYQILQKADDYVLAIERFELNLNGIPFYDPIGSSGTRAELITLTSVANPLLSTQVLLEDQAYSISHLFEILNSKTYLNPDDNTVVPFTFSLSGDGFVVLTIGAGRTFSDFTVSFPYYLNQILGISEASQVAGLSSCQSSFPRIDMGDELNHIILTSNLPTRSDTLGAGQIGVITDFVPVSSYSNSLSYGATGELIDSGISTFMRQKLIYLPNEKRFVDLDGPFQIQNIRVEAWYINNGGSLFQVKLPLGGTFSIKLGFYLKE